MLLVALALVQQPPVGSPAWIERNRSPMPRLEPCAVQGARTASTLGELSQDVRAELERFFSPDGGLSDAGGPFNATDVVNSRAPVPQRRFLRAINRGDRWIIWYEHGGRGYHRHAIGVRLERRDGRDRARVDPFSRFGGFTSAQLCRASQAYFDGVTTMNDS